MFQKVYRDGKATVEGLSRCISGGADRLDQLAPSVEPYRSELEKHDISVIDLTKLKSGDALNHGKFAESPEVARLIGDRLVTGRTITDQDVGVGEALQSRSAPSARRSPSSIRQRVAAMATRFSASAAACSTTPSARLAIALIPPFFDNNLALPQSSKSTASPAKNR